MESNKQNNLTNILDVAKSINYNELPRLSLYCVSILVERLTEILYSVLNSEDK